MSASDTVVWPGGTPEAERQNGAVVDFPSTRARPGGRPQRLLPLRSEAHSSRGRRGWLMRRMLLAADLIALSTAFVVVDYIFRSHGGRHDTVAFDTEFLLFFVTLPSGWSPPSSTASTTATRRAPTTARPTTSSASSISSPSSRGSRRRRVLHRPRASGASRRSSSSGSSRSRLSRSSALPRARSAAGALLYLQNTVIVGAGDVGQLLAAKILRHPEYGINLLGFVDDRPKEQRPGLEQPDDPRLAEPARGDRRGARRRAGDRRVLERLDRPHRRARALAASRPTSRSTSCRASSTSSARAARSTRVEGIPLLGIPALRLSRTSRLAQARARRRARQLARSSSSRRCSLAIAIAIKLDTPGPVFFRQRADGRRRAAVPDLQVPDDGRRRGGAQGRGRAT